MSKARILTVIAFAAAIAGFTAGGALAKMGGGGMGGHPGGGYHAGNYHRPPNWNNNWNHHYHGPRCGGWTNNCRYYYNGWWYQNPWWLPAIGTGVYISNHNSKHINWCRNRYRSYNPSTNTYVSSSGKVKQCNSPY